MYPVIRDIHMWLFWAQDILLFVAYNDLSYVRYYSVVFKIYFHEQSNFPTTGSFVHMYGLASINEKLLRYAT